MEYSMVLSNKTKDKLFYKYGASKNELDGRSEERRVGKECM